MLKLPTIENYSPRLAGLLRRREFSGNITLLEEALAFSLAHGAMNEPDHIRPANQAYNPRPARIAIILINDAKITDTNTLAAAILATCPSEMLGQSPLSQEIISLAKLSQLPVQEIAKHNDSATNSAYLISAVIALDRARHIHLVKPFDSNLLQSLATEIKVHINLGSIEQERIYSLLKSWLKSVERF